MDKYINEMIFTDYEGEYTIVCPEKLVTPPSSMTQKKTMVIF
jgi:hypothetical protein